MSRGDLVQVVSTILNEVLSLNAQESLGDERKVLMARSSMKS